MLFTETQIIARYAETDQMGIIHHSNYPIWYEVGRTEFIKKLGISYTEMESNGVLLPLIKMESEFKKIVKYEDEVLIKTFINDLTNVRITFKYEIYKQSILVNTGKTFHVFADSDLKPVNLIKKDPQIFDLLSVVFSK